MKSLLKVIVCFVLGIAFAVPSLGFAAEKANGAHPPTPTKELPWFLQNIAQTNVPADQWKIYLREMSETWNCFQGNPNAMDLLIPGDDSYAYQTDIVSTSSVSEKPLKMKLILDHYVEIKTGADKGKFSLTTLCGKKILTRHEVEVVRDYMIDNVMKPAVKADSLFWAPILHNAIQIGVEKRVDKGKAAEWIKRLDEKMPGYDITYRDHWQLPTENKDSDFVPVEYHLGYSLKVPGIFGLTWLNVGRVYLNPQALQIDYIAGRPTVAIHEFVHGNANVENFPLSEAYDAELVACFPMAFATDDQLDFFFHGYLALPRRLANIYFSYDFTEAMKQNIRFADGTGNWDINEKAWNENLEKTNAIKNEFMTLLGPEALAEFYSDPMYWAGMNDMRKDKNVVFRMMMAKLYDATSLGGRDETVKWREANKERIIRIAKKSMDDLQNDSIQLQISGAGDIPSYLIALYQRTFTAGERAQLESYFGQHPDELQRLLYNPEKLVKRAFTLTHKQGGVQ